MIVLIALLGLVLIGGIIVGGASDVLTSNPLWQLIFLFTGLMIAFVAGNIILRALQKCGYSV